MKRISLLVGVIALLTVGCVTEPRAPVNAPDRPAAPSARTSIPPVNTGPSAKPARPEKTTLAPSTYEAGATLPPSAVDTMPERQPPPPPSEELAVLKVQAGAFITQVNGDPKLRCTRPDCSIPLRPGTHRFSVLYRDTAKREGSTVTYASMYPRVIEVTLEPGHSYSVTASGRYSRNWWVAVEDQTTNKIVYNDRKTTE